MTLRNKILKRIVLASSILTLMFPTIASAATPTVVSDNQAKVSEITTKFLKVVLWIT